MIKAAIRYIIILAAACLVAFGMYWLVEKNGSALGINVAFGREGRGEFPEMGSGEFQPRPRGQRLAPAEGFPEGTAPDAGFREHNNEFERGGAGSILGLGGVLKNIVIIAAITLGVLLLTKAFEWLTRRGRKIRSAA